MLAAAAWQSTDSRPETAMQPVRYSEPETSEVIIKHKCNTTYLYQAINTFTPGDVISAHPTYVFRWLTKGICIPWTFSQFATLQFC